MKAIRSTPYLVMASVLLGTFSCGVVDALVITEIHYNPGGSGDLARRSEFVEIYNDDPGPLDLSGYFFSEGVSFIFSDGTLLGGGEYLVVAADQDFLRALSRSIRVVGNWSSTTALDNGGERISVANRSGVVVASVDYNDRDRWPAAADGTGYSLALRKVFCDNGDADNWTWSGQPGGTPGRENFPSGLIGGEQPDRDPIDANGFILRWLVLGPYQGASCDPGDAINEDWLTEGPGGVQETDLVWTVGQTVRTDYDSAESTGLHLSAGTDLPTLQSYQSTHDTIDFDDEVYGSSINTMAYAITYVFNQSGGPLSTDMALASDDGIQVLVGGTVVHTNSTCRSSGSSGSLSDYVPVTLAEGRNLVMVKLFHSGGEWQFRLRFENPDNGTPLGPESGLTGSPATSVPEGLRINEALIDTAGPRWVELYNSTTSPIDVGGLHLTDTRDRLMKAVIPTNTLVPEKGWLALEDSTLGLDFSLDLPGGRDRVFIGLVNEAGTAIIDAYTFKPSVPEHSEARIPDGSGGMEVAADPTRDGANEVTVNNWIVLNEIQYHPMFDDPVREYLELFHRGSEGDPDVDLRGWKITGGVNFAFPPGTTMSPGEYLLVAHDRALLESIYDLSGVQVLGPDSDSLSIAAFGVLRNSGERVTLVDDLGNTVDTFRYHDGGHWPHWPDGGGPSLELIDPWAENDSPQAWDASDDSEKSEVGEFAYRAEHVGGESELHFHMLGRGITIVDDIFLKSSGPGSEGTLTRELIALGDSWRYSKGTAEPPPIWTQLDFDDSSWLLGPTGIGFGDNDDATLLDDMQFQYLSVYCRREFTIEDLAAALELTLEIDFDDGYVAYLNGTEIARSGLEGDPPTYLAPAAEREAGSFEVVDLTDRLHLLREGSNVLAVQVHNRLIDSSDLSFRPRLRLLRTWAPGLGNNLLLNGDFDIDAGSWTIEGNHIGSGRTELESITGPGSLKLVATGRGNNKANRVETDVPFGLTPGASYEVSFKARWVVGAPTLVTRGYDHGLARSHRLAVPDDLGTPGTENSVTERQIASADDGNLGPVIDDVSQTPALPEPFKPVTVRARIRDSVVDLAGLRYAINSPNAVFSSVGMTGPDEEGFYEAEIPGQARGVCVLFEIVARDGSGSPRSRYPTDDTERSHPLVLDPTRSTAVEQRYVVYRHDTGSTDPRFHTYRFVMHDEAERQLATQRLQSNAYADGSLVFEDKIYHHSQLRFAGSAWSRAPWGSFRVRMAKDNRLQGRTLKINLDNRHGRVPRDARERIGHYLIGQNNGSAKVPFLNTRSVHFKVNSRFQGDLEQVEVPDQDFLSSWFPDDDQGDLFEMSERFEFNDGVARVSHIDARWLHPPYGDQGDNKEEYRYYFGRRNQEEHDDYGSLIEAARILTPAKTSDADFDRLVWEHFDVEAFLRVWAVRLNIYDWDSYGADRGKNAYFYRPEVDGRWVLVPWDLELTFGNLNGFAMPSNPSENWSNTFSEVERFLNRPCIKRMYYGVLAEMVDGPFSSEHLDPYLDLLVSIGAGNTHFGRPGNFIDQRASMIRAWIKSSVYPQRRLEITTQGGADYNHSSISLDGTSPADILFLHVLRNGSEVEPAPEVNVCEGFFDWSIDEVPLVVGLNELLVLGFDGNGDMVDSDSIQVMLSDVQAFVRGDGNDDGSVDLVDVLWVLFYAFDGSVLPRCEDALDVDDSSVVDLTDAFVLLGHLFTAGPPPAPPFPQPGVDPSGDGLLSCVDSL